MAERRKIVIPTGLNPDEPLPTPHFDAEATMTARPVVPLVDPETNYARSGQVAGSAAKPFWKRPALLVLVALVAIGVGVAAGFAIGLYRNRTTAQSSPAASPTPLAENADIGQTVEPPLQSPPQIRAPAPAITEHPPGEPEEEAKPAAREERRNDRGKQPVLVPDQERESSNEDDRIAEDREERQIEREQRRAERRERRRRERDEDSGVPRQVDRAGREVDRIREIFEGRQP